MKTPLLLAAAALLALVSRLPGSDIVVQEPRMVPTLDLALSDDGRLLVTVGIRGQLSVWDSLSGELLETLEGEPGSKNPTFTPDNRYVSGIGAFGGVVWDWLNRQVIWSHSGHDLSGVAVDSVRGKIHVAAKTELRQYSLADGKELARIPLGEVEIGTLSLTDKGELLILCKKTGLLFVDPDTNQVTRRVDLEYPRESYFTPGQIEKKPELGKVAKRITGIPYGRIDRSRSRFRLYVGSFKLPPEGKPWFRTFAADGSATSEKHPISLPENQFPWFGDTGKLLWLRDGRHVEVIDPTDPSRRETLPISFPPARVITRIDTDRAGRLIAVSTDQGWFCYDGNPGDPQSWKLRELPSVPPVVTVRSTHPDGKTMLYSSASGAIGGVALEAGLPHRLLGKLDKEVRLITTFPDGKLMVSSQAEHMIFEEGQPPLSKGEREIHSTWHCRDFILRNAPGAGISNAKVEMVRSNGEVLGSFTDKDGWPEVHPVKPLVLHRTASSDTARYKFGEITTEGEYRLLHDFERVDDTGYFAIPESTDSALLLATGGELHRIDVRTRKSKKLRDGLPYSLDEVHPSADGKFLTALWWSESRALVIPLDPKKPCIDLVNTAAEFGTGIRNWIGYTPNQHGAWLDDHNHLAELPQSYAGLWNTESGKLVARLRVHEDGAALLLLPDGRCHFNQQAAGLVKRRKAGEITLSPAKPSPEVFEVLAPYLKVP